MKHFVLAIILFFGLSAAAQDIPSVLPSETGVVQSIEYVDDTRQNVVVKVVSGKFKGALREIENIISDNPVYNIVLERGTRVILHVEPVSEFIGSAADVNFYIADLKRSGVVWLFAAIFCFGLIIIGRLKGLFALISIIATVALIFFVLVPMVLNGFSPIIGAMIVSILSTVITMYLVGGLNTKSTAAALGTALSLIVSAVFSVLAIKMAHLTGFNGEEAMFLYSARPDLDFHGILAASIILAALGALMDTAISIASTVNEIYETDPALEFKELVKSGMNVGKDVIGTMSNTLILVYLGASLPLVLLSSNIDLQKFFNLNATASEILSALVGSIGILACVPVTVVITAYLIKRRQKGLTGVDFSG